MRNLVIMKQEYSPDVASATEMLLELLESSGHLTIESTSLINKKRIYRVSTDEKVDRVLDTFTAAGLYTYENCDD